MTQIKITKDHWAKARDTAAWDDSYADIANRTYAIAEAEEAEFDSTAVKVNGEVISRDKALELYSQTKDTHDWFLGSQLFAGFDTPRFTVTHRLGYYTYKLKEPAVLVNGQKITVKEAKELYHSTKDTHNWWMKGDEDRPYDVFDRCPIFNLETGYTYKLKKLIVDVNGEKMTQSKAKELYEKTKGTHDWFLDGQTYWWDVFFTSPTIKYTCCERKPKLKLIDWKNPLMSGCQVETGELITDNSVGFRVIEWCSIPCVDVSELRLAPPEDATSNWQVYHHGVTDLTKLEGVEIEVKYWDSWNSRFTVVNSEHLLSTSYFRIAAYRLTGKLLDGYTDDPSKAE